AEELVSTGLYETLRSRGVVFSVATQTLGAKTADSAAAELLEIETGSPLLPMSRTALAGSGTTVECGDRCYCPELYSLASTIVSRRGGRPAPRGTPHCIALAACASTPFAGTSGPAATPLSFRTPSVTTSPLAATGEFSLQGVTTHSNSAIV